MDSQNLIAGGSLGNGGNACIGSDNNGGGGGGFLTDGITPNTGGINNNGFGGLSFLNGGVVGQPGRLDLACNTDPYGGFGGGGSGTCATVGSGSGGGYSGGAGGPHIGNCGAAVRSSGGGGSYNIGTNPLELAGSNYSSKSLSKIFEKHISTEAKITTDSWSGYKPLMKRYPDFEQKLSNKGQNFKMLHIQIRNFKNWLRGVHSYCEKETLNQYIEEYLFRFNRLNFRETILEKLLCRMVKEKPINYKSIKCYAI